MGQACPAQDLGVLLCNRTTVVLASGREVMTVPVS